MKQLIVLEPEVKKSASSRRRHFQVEHTEQRCQGCATSAPEGLVLDSFVECVTSRYDNDEISPKMCPKIQGLYTCQKMPHLQISL